MNNVYLALESILLAAVSDLLCNICIKKSDGFTVKRWGILVAGWLIITNTAITFSYTAIDLSIAYALFGVLSLLCTTAIDKLLFGLKINGTGVLGLVLLISGIVLLRVA